MSNSWHRCFSPDLIANVQAAQDALADLAGVSLCVLDRDGNPCTISSNEPASCFHAQAHATELCRNTLRQAVRQAAIELRPSIHRCHLGLTSAVVPLGVSPDEGPSAPAAFLNIGRVRVEGDDDAMLDALMVRDPQGGHQFPPAITPARFAQVVAAVGDVFNLLFVLAASGGLTTQAPSLLHQPTAEASCLTRREREIVSMVGTGLSNQAIGSRLFISEKTVKTHITNALHKLSLTNRTELALYAVQVMGKGDHM